MIRRRCLFSLAALVLGLLWFGSVSVARAQQSSGSDVSVRISQESAALMAGDWITFTTVVSNESAQTTPPLVASLNITAVKTGPHVDPEDWSPQRTQYVRPLQPGESTTLEWQLHALLEGEFAAFVAIVSTEASFVPAVSQDLLLHMGPDNILPMNEVLPVVTFVPLFPLALLLWNVLRSRRRPQTGA